MYCVNQLRALVSCIAVIALVSGCGGRDDNNVTSSNPPSAHPRAQAAGTTGELHLQVTDGQVSIKATDVALDRLLRELADRSGLTVVAEGPLLEPMTVRFERLSLNDAIHWILRDRNYTVGYAQPTTDGGPSRPEIVFVLAKASVEAWVEPSTTSDERGALIDALTQTSLRIDRDEGIIAHAMAMDDATVRLEAVDALGEVAGDGAIEMLAHALSDQERAVREAAVQSLGNIGGDAAATALAQALADPQPQVREEAVDALGAIDGEIARRLLHRALADRDEGVRETAAGLLGRLQPE